MARALELAAVQPGRSVEWVNADSLEVNPLAQRPFDDAWAAKIAANFDQDGIGVPVIAEVREGGRIRRFVLDGQHRVWAFRHAMGPDQQLQCEVLRETSLQRAAQIFVVRNTARGVKPVYRFLMNVNGGDPESVAINEIVEGYGLAIAERERDGSVRCVNALLQVYRGNASLGKGRNVLALKRAIGVALQAWGRSVDALQGDVLHGLGLVTLKHGDELDFMALEKRMAQIPGGAAGLIGKARGSRAVMAGSMANNVAAVIVREYNKGRRKHALPEWFTAA